MESALIVLGVGGLAHECWETLLLTEPEALSSAQGYADPVPATPHWSDEGFRVVDPMSRLLRLTSLVGSRVVIAIGDITARQRLAVDVIDRGGELMTIKHPTASVGRSCTVIDGSIILAQSVLTANVQLGRCCVVNPGVTISHDSVVGSFCNIGPGVRICGRARIGDNVDLGAGAVILPDRHVGEGARVGAGAVVTQDVGPGLVVKGIPARP